MNRIHELLNFRYQVKNVKFLENENPVSKDKTAEKKEEEDEKEKEEETKHTQK